MRVDGRKIDFFPSLYNEWKDQQKNKYALLERHMEQYRGSAEIDGRGGKARDALVVRNISYEFVEAQVDSRIPAPIITPKQPSPSHLRYARNAMEYLKLQRDEQPFEELNDIDERRTYIYGGSGYQVEWDSTYRTHTEVGRPEVQSVNPVYIIGQPGVNRIQDMDAVFVRYNTTRDDVVSRYGVSYADLDALDADEDTERTDDVITVVVCWYRDTDGNVCKYAFCDTLELEDIDDYWARKREVCGNCGRSAELADDGGDKCPCGGEYAETNEEYEELTHDVATSDGRIIPAYSPVIEGGKIKTRKEKRPLLDEGGNPVFDYDDAGLPVMQMTEIDEPVMEPTRIRWFKPTIFPVVIRKNTSQEDSLLGQSDVEYIRPQQQEINKLESRIQKMLLHSTVAAVMPEDSEAQADDGVFDAVVRLKPGENKGMYGSINTTPDITSLVRQSDRIYDHAQRILGISDSFVGQKDTTAQSGVAKQVQVQQSAGRLSSKKQMKAFAYSELYEIMFQLAVAYADEPRKLAYQDDFGIYQQGEFNRYDYLEQDKDTGEWYYDLSYTFSADVAGGIEQQTEYRWQQIAADYQAGLYGEQSDPTARLRMWLDRDEAGYPGAHKNVEFERNLLRQKMQAYEQEAQAAQEKGGVIDANDDI